MRIRAHARGILRAGGRHLHVLIWMVALFACSWAFLELADDVVEGETLPFDERVLLALRNPSDQADPLGPGWVEELGRDFSALGGLGVLAFITLAAIGYLLLARRARTALFTFAAVSGGMLLSSLLKLGFDRPRPDLVPHETIVYTASFPSGHSMMSAVTYLTLAALLGRVHARRRMKSYLLFIAVLLTLAAGASRVYLGVHWPTDVFAGWAAGAGWASLCWLLARWMQGRGALDRG